MVEAYRRAEASALAPYSYARLIFAAVLGYKLFADRIASTTIVGVLLIVGSNLALLLVVARSGKFARRWRPNRATGRPHTNWVGKPQSALDRSAGG